MRRQRFIIQLLVETLPIDSSNSSSSLTTSSSDELNTSDESRLNEDEVILLFFPLLQYLLTGNSRTRIENYLQLVDSWSDLEFKEHMRLSRDLALQLIDELHDSGFIPQNKFGRTPIGAKLSIYMFLWFCGNMEPLRTISDRFNISISSVFRVVRRVIDWLLTQLDNTIKWPQGINTIIVTDGFYAHRNIPNIIGAIDCTHIRIEKPSENERDYYNREKFPSINLQAIVDSRMRLTNIYCGEPGSLHDARVLRRSPLYETAMNEPETLFPNNTFIIGDSAYPSLPWLVPPFRDNGHLTFEQKELNFLLSSTRMVVERAFGRLKGRFRRIKFFNEYRRIDFVTNLVVALCILHNRCINEGDGFEFEENDDLLGINGNNAHHFEPINNFNERDRRMEIFQEVFVDE